MLCYVQQNMCSKYERWEKDNFHGFDPEGMEFNEVIGKVSNVGLPWRECERVLLPVNIKNEHWVAVALDFYEQRLHVYDSMRSPTIRGQLRPLALMLPKLLAQLGFYDLQPPNKQLKENEGWSVELETTPQQDG